MTIDEALQYRRSSARGAKLRQFAFAIFAGIATLLAVPPSARADFVSSQAWFASLTDQERFNLQIDLILAGKYDRLADGVFGTGTLSALGAFQRSLGADADGVLSDNEMQTLKQQAADKYDQLGIEEIKDQESTLGIYLPSKLLTKQGSLTDLFDGIDKYASGRSYVSDDGQVGIALIKIDGSQRNFADLYAALKAPAAGSPPSYSVMLPDTFTISGKGTEGTYYERFYRSGDDSVGYILFWSDRYRTVGPLIASFTASMTYLTTDDERPAQASTSPPPVATTPPAAGGPAGDQLFAGSGFFFSDHGMIATNYHVAGQCSSLEVVGYGAATLLKGDPDLDLAAIQLDSQRSTAWAHIRIAPPNLAESVLLLGFPLSDILNSSLNVATGIVSAQTGLEGKPDWFTTNAGIQPGNSGGPILDANGNVVGVAVAKIDDTELLKEAGTTAPNIGFGIKDTALLNFLSIFAHSADATVPRASAKTPQELASLGKTFTVQIVCTANAAKLAALNNE